MCDVWGRRERMRMKKREDEAENREHCTILLNKVTVVSHKHSLCLRLKCNGNTDSYIAIPVVYISMA